MLKILMGVCEVKSSIETNLFREVYALKQNRNNFSVDFSRHQRILFKCVSSIFWLLFLHSMTKPKVKNFVYSLFESCNGALVIVKYFKQPLLSFFTSQKVEGKMEMLHFEETQLFDLSVFNYFIGSLNLLKILNALCSHSNQVCRMTLKYGFVKMTFPPL